MLTFCAVVIDGTGIVNSGDGVGVKGIVIDNCGGIALDAVGTAEMIITVLHY